VLLRRRANTGISPLRFAKALRSGRDDKRFWGAEESNSNCKSDGREFLRGPLGVLRWLLEAADEEFAFVDHLWWEVVVEQEEELFVAHDFFVPGGAVYVLELVEFGLGHVEAVPVHVFVVRGPADGGFFALGAAADAVYDPLEDAHVFAEAGPEELAVFVLAEPVDVEDARGCGEIALHAEPVTEVVAHVVTAEGEHGHGVAADFAKGAAGGCGGFRAHGGADVDAAGPVEGLED